MTTVEYTVNDGFVIITPIGALAEVTRAANGLWCLSIGLDQFNYSAHWEQSDMLHFAKQVAGRYLRVILKELQKIK